MTKNLQCEEKDIYYIDIKQHQLIWLIKCVVVGRCRGLHEQLVLAARSFIVDEFVNIYRIMYQQEMILIK